MEWLVERFSASADRVAFAFESGETTYGSLCQAVVKHKVSLANYGVRRGEIVAVVGDYSPDVFCLILALVANANVIIPLTRGSVIAVEAALAVSGCDWVVNFDDRNVDLTIQRVMKPVISRLLAEFVQLRKPGMIFFSSGSTGLPKGILHDFGRIASKFLVQRRPVVAIPFLMLDHFGGINTILSITSSLGTAVTVAQRSADHICSAIERHHVTLLPATPSFLTMLMASGLHRRYDLSSLTRITYGTEVMPQATLNRLRNAFPGVGLQQTYGLSELGVLHSQSRPDGSLWVRIGGDGFQTKVVDGVLFIKSEFAMLGYLNAPSNFDDEGWFNTQDRVEVDGEYFRILGRITDLINVGGQKVYPAEVEDVILSLDNVEDVSVYGEPHALLGNIVVAKISTIFKEEQGGLKMRVRMACRAHLASFKVPSKVVLAEAKLHTARHKKIRQP